MSNESVEKSIPRAGETPARELVKQVTEAMLDKIAEDVKVIDLRGLSGVADYFVVCTADSSTKAMAVLQSVRKHIRETCGESPWRSEGLETQSWMLVDYVNVVAHIFLPDRRDFYQLERLWGDAPIVDVSDDVPFEV